MNYFIIDYLNYKREKYGAEKFYACWIFKNDRFIQKTYINKMTILELQEDGLLYKNKKWFTEEEFRKLIK